MRAVKSIFRHAALTAILVFFAASQGCQPQQEKASDAAFIPQWGVCTGLDNTAKLQNAGYDYIELGVQRFLVPQSSDEDFAKNLLEAQSVKAPLYACNSFLPSSLICVGPAADHPAILTYAETAFRRAQAAGIRVIVFGSGSSRRVPDGFEPAQAQRQFVDLLKKMGPIAEKYGVIIAIEPLNKKECNFINTVAEGTAIAREVNHPNIRVLADFYHMALEDEGPDSIRAAGRLLAHCHIAEKEGRKWPGASGFDFTGYFKALKDIRYRGCISIEGRADDFDRQLPEALAYMKSQWETAGL
ncbi:MAG TPA: sugar phosphate isomerase/epimerase family protein [Anaerohalosphaeraceae bacterium]|nr:sugar phosphate isomerase/epimerase [Phycisphaerae bacterium]HOK95535.1 sugar phosphate isomerase/epimerase family protein [Anaerohalosphaeraceae bacterium]HOL30473.1 sugar phosphate isomerase/epimerase family protein [Anaerohalosphaeraceae bacterium]HOM76339.1 sugar phosphate isomerase/epimerase family protein [Anaerohalosphaeraceae bacterium]HPC65536.1 sugar phosphate isomerase/epimerase family protein [Anaerohalosphaeraceae bacterium]